MWSLECRYGLYFQECLLIKDSCERQTCYLKARSVCVCVCVCVPAPSPHPLEERAVYVTAAFGRAGVPECSLCNESQYISFGVAPGLPLRGMYHLLADAKLDATEAVRMQLRQLVSECLAWLSTKTSPRLSGCRSGAVSLKSRPGRPAHPQHRFSSWTRELWAGSCIH